MNLLLERDVKTPEFTLGKLHVNGIRLFYSVEDTDREIAGVPVYKWKQAGMTAIPKGTYNISVNYSPRFKKILPSIDNVPGFSGIRIHAGNTADDTSGCVLVGTRRTKDGVGNSREALQLLRMDIERILDAGSKVTITIKDAA